MSRVCPDDGEELILHAMGYITGYYHCPKCKKRFKGFLGDSDMIESKGQRE